MRKGMIVGVASVAALGIGIGVASAAGGSGRPAASRLDDGRELLSDAAITERQAIAAAQAAASGALNEVDLEHVDGRLVFNVDVGPHDVKVDAATAKVVSVDSDD